MPEVPIVEVPVRKRNVLSCIGRDEDGTSCLVDRSDVPRVPLRTPRMSLLRVQMMRSPEANVSRTEKNVVYGRYGIKRVAFAGDYVRRDPLTITEPAVW
jgi:hypothetical protein